MYEVVDTDGKVLCKGDFYQCSKWCENHWPECTVDGRGEDYNGNPMTAYVSDVDDNSVAEIQPA